MNKRIKELINQCQEERQYGPSWFNFKKFAELLIQECADVCLEQHDPSNLNYKPSEKFAEAIKHHFGVEK